MKPLKIIVCVFITWMSAASRWGAVAGTAPASGRPPTLEEIGVLFSRVTRPAPPKFHIVLRLEVCRSAWTEQQVLKELKHQEALMANEDSGLTRSQRDELRSLRLDGIRKAHTGTNVWDLEVWVSGELYRRDEVWISIPNPSKRSFVYIGETNFSSVSSFIVNHTVGSATLYTNATQTPVSVDPLSWAGWTLEPPFPMPVLLALADTNSIVVGGQGSFHDFGRLRVSLDRVKADRVTRGQGSMFKIAVTADKFEGRPAKCFRLEPQHGLMFEPWVASYWLDAENPALLYRAEMRPGSGKGEGQSSVREGFDARGWPAVVASETLDHDGRPVLSRLTYVQVDVPGEFDEHQTFAPVFPTNFYVEVSSGTGLGVLVQNPRGAKVISPQSREVARRGVWIGLAVLLLIAPAVILLRARSREAGHRK